jgi:hypothetical protein
MAQLVNSVANVQLSPDFTLLEAFSVGLVKVVSEKALSRVQFVGNGTFRSGTIKGLLAMGAFALSRKRSGMLGSAGKVASTALAVDAVEDVLSAAMAKWGRNGSSASAAVSVEDLSSSAYI